MVLLQNSRLFCSPLNDKHDPNIQEDDLKMALNFRRSKSPEGAGGT